MKSKTVYIGYDLHLNLKLYNLPKNLIQKIKSLGLNLSLVKINGEKDKILEKIEIYFGNRITDKIIGNSPNLKWIHFGSIGIDSIKNKKQVKKRKIIVTNSKGTMEDSVAVSVISSMLYFSRGLDHVERLRRKRNLNRKSIDKFFDNFSDLKNTTCLIVGRGTIGKKIEKICKSMSIKILSIQKRRNMNKKSNKYFFKLDDLENLVKRSDFIVNLLPLTDETKNAFNKKIFNKMKSNSIFINMGRGKTINEKDLYNILKLKKIRGAALDVFEFEPLLKESILWKLDNLLITPHIAGLHDNYWSLEEKLFLENLRRYFESDKLINRVKLDKEY